MHPFAYIKATVNIGGVYANIYSGFVYYFVKLHLTPVTTILFRVIISSDIIQYFRSNHNPLFF